MEDNSKLMQLEIENKKKLPKEVKDKIGINIFKNLIAAIIVMVYLLLINFTYNKATDKFEEFMKYYSLGAAIISVILFEIAYNKGSRFFCLVGIELLCCGIVSIFIPYIYLHTSSELRTAIILLPAILVFYYLIKTIIIFKSGQIKYNNSLIDIKDILSDNEKSYLDEDSEKVYKKKLKEEEKLKEEIKKEQEIRRLRRIKK